MEKYLMKVNGCCCCFSLRRGTLILLWLGLISSVLIVIMSIGGMTYINNAFAAHSTAHSTTHSATHSATQDANKLISSVIFLFTAVNVIFLKIIPCALGLYGIYGNKPSYLKPYIFVSIFAIVMALIACVFILLVAIFSVNYLEELMQHYDINDPRYFGNDIKTRAFSVILSYLVSALLGWYFLSVVYRYYQQMKGVQQTSYSVRDYNAPPRYDEVPIMKV